MRHAGNERNGSGESAPCSTISAISCKQLARELLVTAEDSVHGHHVEGRIAPQRPKRDAGVLINVAFADLDEAAELRQAGKPHRNRFAGERIQD